jgi:hypothetical protein
VKAFVVVPTMLATVVVISTMPSPSCDLHVMLLSDVHDEVVHDVEPMYIVGVYPAVPKLKPVTVKDCPPVFAPLILVKVATGESNVNLNSELPTTAEMVNAVDFRTPEPMVFVVRHFTCEFEFQEIVPHA